MKTALTGAAIALSAVSLAFAGGHGGDHGGSGYSGGGGGHAAGHSASGVPNSSYSGGRVSGYRSGLNPALNSLGRHSYGHQSALNGGRVTVYDHAGSLRNRQFYVNHPGISGINRGASAHHARSLSNTHGHQSRVAGNAGRHTTNTDRAKVGNAASRSHRDAVSRGRLDPKTSAKLRNWHGRAPGLAEARHNSDGCKHHHHDDNWWHNHCAAIVFIWGGFWGWDAGWWYPAWGYDPYYSYYAYDGPIYAYNGLPPDEVIANVQSALQELGYYRYAVDGIMGPATEAAIANYQRDNGLSITGAIDQPTLISFGFNAQ